MEGKEQSRLRELPAVHKVLSWPNVQLWIEEFGHEDVVNSVQKVLDEWRRQILAGSDEPMSEKLLLARVKAVLTAYTSMHLRRVINATGTVLHTNLGRAPLADEALEAIISVARGYSNLEYDLTTGERGHRYEHIEALICELVGSEAALVVNNNAAAVFLMLNELTSGKKVVISRGELVEIGGSFRVSEVMRASGAELVEVGTTNKTHLRDYEQALQQGADLVLRVHTSNFRIIGFTEQPVLKELVALTHAYQLPFFEDLGSGSLIDFRQHGLGDEPTIRDSLAAGVDVVSFSGDKLLGGAQAGFLCGKKAFIDRLKKNQLARALRVDKLTLAAIEATLRLYRDEARAKTRIPTLRMLLSSAQSLQEAAEKLAVDMALSIGDRARCRVLATVSKVGGGALPQVDIPTYAVAVVPFAISPEQLLAALRNGNPAVVARVASDEVIFDLRTLLEGDIQDLLVAVRSAFDAIGTSSEARL